MFSGVLGAACAAPAAGRLAPSWRSPFGSSLRDVRYGVPAYAVERVASAKLAVLAPATSTK